MTNKVVDIERTRIAFITTGSDIGGAELMLYQLVAGLAKRNYEIEVFILKGMGQVAGRMLRLGVTVNALKMQGFWGTLRGCVKLGKGLVNFQPHVVQTWMYHSDLIGGLTSRLFTKSRVIWGIRNSTLEPTASRRETRIVRRICSFLSPWVPDAIVSCSETARQVHEKIGYKNGKFVVIPNGFDPNSWNRSLSDRKEFRKKYGLSNDIVLIGVVGRFHPQKDHENYFSAAQIILRKTEEARFLLCGKEITEKNSMLADMIVKVDLQEQTLLLGERDDMRTIYSALDILVLPSKSGEAFPNVLAEAQLCNVLVVATDVGDTGKLIVSPEAIVHKQDSNALAGAVLKLVHMGPEEKQELIERGRNNILSNFSLEKMILSYENIYSQKGLQNKITNAGRPTCVV